MTNFTIIGAGSAGCVLANRLSKNPQNNVVLIEAGGSHRRWQIDVPIGYGKSFFDPKVNWCLHTAPDNNTSGSAHYWPRGKVLGGSSAINAMVIMRGLAQDFDGWSKQLGSGWDWQELQPYYSALSQQFFFATQPEAMHPMCQQFFAACAAQNIPQVADLNASETASVGYYPLAIQNGKRVSTASAYLNPIRSRKNLQIRTDIEVRKICFDDTMRPTALDIRHATDGDSQIPITGEVLLCAGSIHTPVLLERSGIGSKAILKQHGVSARIDNAHVGMHLQDHLGASHYFATQQATLNDALGTWSGKIRAALQYGLFRKGPLSLSLNHAGGYAKLHPNSTAPDTQIYFSPMQFSSAPKGTRPKVAVDQRSGFLLGFNIARPQSEGSVHMGLADTVKIVPNYLDAAYDQEMAVLGSRFMQELGQHASMKAVISAKIAPSTQLSSDAEFLQDFRARCGTVYHPCGTARMAQKMSDGVVDTDFRVFGTKALRIVDASIFPTIPSANLSAVVMILAEKISATILKSAQQD